MKTRIAVFSDVHGNLSAMRAMYRDSRQQHIDQYWFVGDLLMPGPSVSEIWRLLKIINPSVIVRGNWDDLVVNGVRGKIDVKYPSHIYFARLAQYVSQSAPRGMVDEIASWPLHVTKKVGPLNFGISHNLPWLNMGQDLFPTQSTKNFDQVFTPADPPIDVAIYAHVHHEIMRYASDERIVMNPGAVGEPFNGWDKLHRDMRAHYLVIEVDDLGMASVNFRHVGYDRKAEQAIADQSAVPYVELYDLMMHTGRAYTHDPEKLTRLNQKYGYATQYLDYCKRLGQN
ncbi:MAG: metallophosphoesterase family protein [Limosilactobacillus vaginalis]|uniref:metallophosphoesterase family protein n=1 Tax=Limosilactobacillus vaginalis TaxID=1633 RepID=UPI003735096D